MTDPYRFLNSNAHDAEREFDASGQEKLYLPKGRINRTKFIVYQFFLVLPAIFVLIITPHATNARITIKRTIARIGWISGAEYANKNGIIKRLHDVDASGWWALTAIIFNVLVVFVLAVVPGIPETNRFGPTPKRSSNLIHLLSFIAIGIVVFIFFVYPVLETMRVLRSL